jgi:hypothetical protein
MDHTKTRKLILLTKLKTNTMPSYRETTSYNSSLDGTGIATSLSTHYLQRNYFCYLCTCDQLVKPLGGKKNMF